MSDGIIATENGRFNMNHALLIKSEMDRLEKEMELLRKQLQLIQSQCEHRFVEDRLSQHCSYCYFVESLYY